MWQRERQTDRQTYRQTDRVGPHIRQFGVREVKEETDRLTDRQMVREREGYNYFRNIG